MSASEPFSWLTIVFSQLATQLPVIIATLVGIIVVLVRWKQVGRAAPWAVAGFGAYLATCVIAPMFYAFMQYRMMQGEVQGFGTIYAVAAVFWSLLSAASLALLLVAIIAGRSARSPVVSPTPGPMG